MEARKRPFILIAEDDPDGRLVYEEVIAKTDFQVDYQFVRTGPELVTFLKDAEKPRPHLIIMDLNYPMDGKTLEEIMQDEKIRAVPLIVITSKEEEAAARTAYTYCANSFIIQPSGFQPFVDTLNHVFRYWFEIVKLLP